MRTTVTPFVSRARSDRRGRPWRTKTGFEVRVDAAPAVYTFTVDDRMDEDDLADGHALEYRGVEYGTRADAPAEILDAARAALRGHAALQPADATARGLAPKSERGALYYWRIVTTVGRQNASLFRARNVAGALDALAQKQGYQDASDAEAHEAHWRARYKVSLETAGRAAPANDAAVCTVCRRLRPGKRLVEVKPGVFAHKSCWTSPERG